MKISFRWHRQNLSIGVVDKERKIVYYPKYIKKRRKEEVAFCKVQTENSRQMRGVRRQSVNTSWSCTPKAIKDTGRIEEPIFPMEPVGCAGVIHVNVSEFHDYGTC